MGEPAGRGHRKGRRVRARKIETTVTYLEMPEPPRFVPPQPATPRLALMKADDIPLHFYRYLYETVGRDWLWIERLGLGDSALSRLVHRDGVEVSVLYANGAPAGFFELDFGDRAAVDLVYFGLMPEWVGRRIGPWLLGAAVSEGFSRNASRMTVNTCTLDHPAALGLYQRIGFKPVAQEPRSIALPDAVPLPDRLAVRSRP